LWKKQCFLRKKKVAYYNGKKTGFVRKKQDCNGKKQDCNGKKQDCNGKKQGFIRKIIKIVMEKKKVFARNKN
jgi:hypothetical protein